MATTRRPQPSTPARRSLLLPAVLAGIVLLGVVAVIVSRGGDGGGDSEEVTGLSQIRPVEVAGTPLPQRAQEDDPAVGMTIPEVRGASFDGTPVVVSPDDGATLLVFLAHWCPHCQREVPVLSRWLRDDGLPEGVRGVSIATGTTPDRPNYPPSAWLAENDWPIPVLADDDDGTAGAAFGLDAYPFFVLVDGEGKVVARASGELEPDALEDLLRLITD